MDTRPNIRYDGAYLERYRKGELTPAEAHALEKASLEDPLLADALEGFQSAPRSVLPELSYLKNWVSERVDEHQAAIRYIPKRRSYAPLMQVAAVVLLLAGATWMGYVFWMGPAKPVLADNRNNTAPATQPNIVTESGQVNSTPEMPIPENVATLPPPATETVKETPVNIKDATVLEEMKPIEDRAVAEVTPSMNLPATDQTRERVEADATIQAPVKAPLVSEATRSTMKRQENSTVNTIAEGPVPVVGWTAYEEYLSRNREALPTASNTQVTPNVVLSFEVGADGRPQDIQVERSAGSVYDEKAKNLLRKGPGWIPGIKGKRTELRIQF